MRLEPIQLTLQGKKPEGNQRRLLVFCYCFVLFLKLTIQEVWANLGDTAGGFQTVKIKQDLKWSKSNEFFRFPVHIKVMFTLYVVY